MQPHDWSKFSLKLPIKANPQDIYNAWTTPAGLESWFLRQADFVGEGGIPKGKQEAINTGDTYTWRWFGYSDDTTETGKVLAANGKDHFQFTFGIAGTVTVSLKNVEGETLIELVQDHIPTDEKGKVDFHIGCQGGWLFYMVNLKSLLEGGIDLRNKNEKLKGVLNS